MALPRLYRAQPDDRDIVCAARDGSREGFEQLVGRYQTLACSLAYALTGSLADSEEVAQEAFITVWRRLPEMRAPEHFPSWLYGIIRNISLHFRRSQNSRMSLRGAAVAASSFAVAPPSALDRVIGREEEQALWRALKEVPESYRIPLVLFYRDRQSIERIAHALGLSQENVRQRLKRGRERLQQATTDMLEVALVGARRGKDLTGKVMAAVALLAAGRAEAAPRGFGKGAPGKALFIAGVAAVGLFAIRGEQQPRRPSRRAEGMTTSSISFLGAPAARLSSPTWERGGGPFVMDFDFENGILPSVFAQGHIVPAPFGAPSRYCAIGTIGPEWLENPSVEIASKGDDPLFVASEGGAISFDHWLGDDNFREFWNTVVGAQPGSAQTKYGWELAPISFSLWDFDADPDQGGTRYDVYLYQYETETWAHLDLALSRFVGVGVSRPIQNGDRIVRFAVFAGQAGGKPFYLDNLKFEPSPRPPAWK